MNIALSYGQKKRQSCSKDLDAQARFRLNVPDFLAVDDMHGFK